MWIYKLAVGLVRAFLFFFDVDNNVLIYHDIWLYHQKKRRKKLNGYDKQL